MARQRRDATKATQPAKDINLAQKVAAAIEMRKAGHDWAYIATSLGIRGGKGSAYNLVNNALKAERREATEELRTLEAMRLDNLLTVYWPKAMDGDGWSFDRVLRLMERRAQLLGIDTKQEPSTSGPVIIEIPTALANAIRGTQSAPAFAPLLEGLVSDA